MLATSERRTIIYAIIAVVAALLVFRVVPSWLAWNERLRQDADELVEEATAAEELLLALPGLYDTLAIRSRSVVALGTRTVGGGTPDAAAALLGSRLSSVAEVAGLQIESVQVSSDTIVWENFAQLTARARLVGSYESLLSALVAIETDPAGLGVTQLTVRREGSGANGQLHVEMSITGIALREKYDGR